MNQEWLNQLPIQNIKKCILVRGGDVNEAFRIETKDDIYFLLVQHQRSEDFYDAEVAGLEAFQEAGVRAPIVKGRGEINSDAYLILSYLEEGRSGSQRELGKLVAKLHSHHEPSGKFGFHLPYHGSAITFENGWQETWTNIFVEQRLDQLRNEIVKQHLWTEEEQRKFEQVREIIVDTLENHNSKPSLLHGDLWAGNYMFLDNGEPVLFDPSPLYGDREFDLGATRVFGGFTKDFYDAYNESLPLSKGAEFRIQFYELYLLMVHLVKFGEMYAGSVNRTMNDILEAHI
ncbi:fructosamine kinase family protein [Mammaliicoccus sp. Dog046]|uniref:fructosamine kinase family protein n=1 Tax=Mammaliicoccus sp. Dog046 TaxID=3034233 RepID=UPI002B25AD39|nr:fructosamine kinase family protein [Mammaliicoccus sp. Dog046]WQK85743.1 fructosamine kinase family protein [Mammaliicoccus sp. Dog046]